MLISGKRYTDEFKIEAVPQVSDRGHSVAEVASRLGVTTHSLYAWLRKFGPEAMQFETASQDEIRRLKAELRRVTEERDIVNTPPAKAGGFRLRLKAGSIGRPADC